MLIFEYILNGENVVQAIKYSKHKLKTDLVINLIFTMIFSIVLAAFLFLHIKRIVYGVIIFVLPLVTLSVIGMWLCYVKEKKFRLSFEKESIMVSYGKKSLNIFYNDIKTVGILHGVGPSNLLELAGAFNSRNQYDAVFVSVTDKINLKKLSYHILTRVSASCGFYKKTTFFISDYNNNVDLGLKIKESMAFYANNDTEIIEKSRTEIES